MELDRVGRYSRLTVVKVEERDARYARTVAQPDVVPRDAHLSAQLCCCVSVAGR